MNDKIFIHHAYGTESQYIKELATINLPNTGPATYFTIQNIPLETTQNREVNLKKKFLEAILVIVFILAASTIFISYNNPSQPPLDQKEGITLPSGAPPNISSTSPLPTQSMKLAPASRLAKQTKLKKTTGDNTNSQFNGYDIKGIESIVKKVEKGSEQWRKEAEQRINKYRKANLTIKVVSARNGKPVPNAKLEIKQLTHKFKFGGILNASQYRANENLYQTTFKHMGFNASGFNNALKYKLWRGAKKRHPEEIIEWLLKNNIAVRGHCLIWPGFSQGGSHLPKELIAILNKYKKTPSEKLKSKLHNTSIEIVKKWAKKWDVTEWDVINEPRGNHVIQDILGKKIEAEWFNTAYQYSKNKNIKLCLNENRVISDKETKKRVFTKVKGRRKKKLEKKFEVRSKNVMTYYNNVKELLKNKAPISALGFQSRFGSEVPPDIIYKRLQVFDEFNMPIKATEFEMKEEIGNELDKAAMTERVMTVYFSHRLVDAIYAWTLFPNDNNREIVDKSGKPNLRGKVWLYLTKNRWNTHVKTATNAHGIASIRGFKGTYEITISGNGQHKTKKVTLYNNKTLKIDL